MDLVAAEPDQKIYSIDDLKELDVAFVHYWLVTWRGGEKVLAAMLKLFPRADVYTLFYDQTTCGPHLQGHCVYPSRLNLPLVKKHYQKLFPLYPLGIKSLRLKKKYDMLISSESGPAKGVHNPSHIPHLCYIHTPMRYCWGYTASYLDSLPGWLRSLAERQFKRLQQWDLTTVNKVDRYVANSYNVADRVKRFYGKEALTCYPPIALDLFDTKLATEPRDCFLSFGALVPYKNIKLLIETFSKLDDRLVVIGDGSERTKLEQMATANIEFHGNLSTDRILSFIRRSKALLFPGEEDFGMIPLEVMSQGIPVIAYKKGGALESVVENGTDRSQSSGIFFEQATVESLTDAINRFKAMESKFDPEWIRKHARSFGEDRFQQEMTGHILDLLNTKYRLGDSRC
jgi:glycosyltransferase involved in cell wall biosynthesis